MQAIRLLAASATEPILKLHDGQLPNGSGEQGLQEEGGNNFGALLGAAVGSLSGGGTSSRPTKGPTHGKGAEEPNRAVRHSEARVSGDKTAALGSAVIPTAGKSDAVRQVSPVALFLPATPSSSKPPASSTLSDRAATGSEHRQGGAAGGALQSDGKSGGSSGLVLFGLNPPPPTLSRRETSSSASNASQSTTLSRPRSLAAVGDSRGPDANGGGAFSTGGVSADPRLSSLAAPGVADLARASEGPSRSNVAPRHLDPSAANPAPAGDWPPETNAAQPASGTQAGHIEAKHQSRLGKPGAVTLEETSAGASALAARSHGPERKSSTGGSSAGRATGSAEDSASKKAALEETIAIQGSARGDASSQTSQAIQAENTSQRAASGPGQLLTSSAFAQARFESVGMTNSYKDNHSNESGAFAHVTAGAGSEWTGGSSFGPTGTPSVQVTVATQAAQETFDARSQMRVASFRVESEGSAARGVVREGSDGMWAALLPSTAEAASLTQAQVPQLRHAIESLGFVVGDISVGVNPQGANKEKSGNGNGGEQHAARLTSDPKSGEIFFTEEVG